MEAEHASEELQIEKEAVTETDPIENLKDASDPSTGTKDSNNKPEDGFADAEPQAGLLGKWKGMADSFAAKYTKSASDSGEGEKSEAKTLEFVDSTDGGDVENDSVSPEDENESNSLENEETVEEKAEKVDSGLEISEEQHSTPVSIEEPREKVTLEKSPESSSEGAVPESHNSTPGKVKALLKKGIVRWYNSGFALESVLLVSGAYCYWGRG
jgi:hypothetical protein